MHRYLTILIGGGLLLSCSSNHNKLEKNTLPAPMEMIFGQEKQSLETHLLQIDSLIAITERLKVDSLLFDHNDPSYILVDSLGDAVDLYNPHPNVVRIPKINDTEPAIQIRKSYLDDILHGKEKLASYSPFLTELNSIKYVIYIKTLGIVQPTLAGPDNFESGGVASALSVFDVHSKKRVKYQMFITTNSDNIEVKHISSMESSGISQISLEMDLHKNYLKKRSQVISQLFNQL